MRSKNHEFKFQGGGDEPGPAVIRLLGELKGIQQGKVKDSFGWVEAVREYSPKEYAVGTAGDSNGHEKVPSQLP